MARRRRKVVGGLTLAVGSVAGSALIFKRKRERNASRADLYFEDGSMLSLTNGSPGADRLLPKAREILRQAQTP